MRQIILFIVFMVICVSAYSQNPDSINHFHIENNQVVWRKVFKTSLDLEQLFAKAKDSGIFENLEKEETKIRGELKYIDAEPLEYAIMDMSTATFINDNFISGFVVIDFRPGRYRVTLRKIMLTKKNIDSLSIIRKSAFIEREIFRLGKIEFSNEFKKHSSILLDDTFTQCFDFSLMIGDDNW